jgi:hypothetical protein
MENGGGNEPKSMPLPCRLVRHFIVHPERRRYSTAPLECNLVSGRPGHTRRFEHLPLYGNANPFFDQNMNQGGAK